MIPLPQSSYKTTTWKGGVTRQIFISPADGDLSTRQFDVRPVVVGLLATATLLLCNADNFSAPSINPWQFWISLFLFVATFVGTMWMKINPIRMICYAGIAGIVLLY